MASSDSEDFESADEDFDFEDLDSKTHETADTVKETEKSKEVKPTEYDEKPVSSDRDTESILNRLEDFKLENPPLNDKEESNEKNSLLITNVKTETKPEKPPPNDKVESHEKNSLLITNVKTDNETKPDRIKSIPKKLGTKLTLKASPISTSKIPEDIPERLKNENESITNKNAIEIEVPKTQSKELSNVKAKETNLTPQLTKGNSNVNDGWDVEEEDGFEMSASLAKKSAGGVLCDLEQQNDLDQAGYKTNKDQQDDGWGGGGSWGVSSLLSTATDSVTTFSSQVTAGLSTVMETTVGAPDPQTLAAASRETRASAPSKNEDQPPNDGDKSSGYAGFGSLVSGVSFFGSTVINRGLDTLETLGKKTMEVLQEGDPGLKKKRAMLFPNQDKPVLSQILREAKEKADHSDKEKEEKEMARKVHFESLFDDFQGMVHLEALEMLSKQCELKLQILLDQSDDVADLQETISQVRDLCELPDDEDDSPVLSRDQFTQQLVKAVEGLKVKIAPTKIIQVNDNIICRLETLGSDTPTAINQTAISSLAEFTAAGMECFHKSAELLLAKSLRNTPEEADSYVELTSHLCARVSAIANEFTQLLTKKDPIANSSLITNIFMEASNSCSYIKNACQLLVPILQVGAISS